MALNDGVNESYVQGLSDGHEDASHSGTVQCFVFGARYELQGELRERVWNFMKR